ncbi:MAG: WG repeat-containing protein [Acidobacteriota bacterium]|nr:WG repeat-containing protein [Acidobacteriota bacterium]
MENGRASGFIDKTGKLKIPAEFYKAEPFSEGLAVIGHPDDGYIYIDTQGKQAIPRRFALASRFFHGLAHVKTEGGPAAWAGGTFEYIDKTGKRIFSYPAGWHRTG